MSEPIDPRIAAALDHLQRAALELIAAARNALDVAEDLTRDPAPLQALVEGIVSSLTSPGSGAAPEPETSASDEHNGPAARVQRIRVD